MVKLYVRRILYSKTVKTSKKEDLQISPCARAIGSRVWSPIQLSMCNCAVRMDHDVTSIPCLTLLVFSFLSVFLVHGVKENFLKAKY